MLSRKQSLRKPSPSQGRKKSNWWSLEQPLSILSVLAKAIPPIGGLLVLLFFVTIKHFPDLDLSGSIALLWAVAVVGSVIVLFIGLGAMLPSLMELASERPKEKSNRHAAQQLLCTLPGWLVLLFFLSRSNGWLHDSTLEWSNDRLIFILVCMSIILGGVLAKREPANNSVLSTLPPAKKKLQGVGTCLYLAAACVVWAATLAFATTFLLSMGDSEAASPTSQIAATMAWLVFVMAMNAQVIFTGTAKALLKGIVIAIIAFLGLLVILQNLSGLAVGVLRTLQQTDLPVRLVVTEEGCDLLNKAVREGSVCKIRSGEKFAVVCPVLLRSKIGSPFLVEFSPLSAEGRWPSKEGRESVQIPRDYVRSWPLLPLKQANAAGTANPTATPSAILSAITASNDTERAWLDEACGAPGSAPQ
ncbi:MULTISPECIES: hypothetical protein [unclassified Acidovorax]|uniref:hypothetical protein n=1 Tax=unclassified Acidovorax TaxID=2684926 RepID=UPI001C472EEF|nr:MULTISPECIES: hypothetical protein [unclassified Acidovorax]MBV7427336.1 hypothetical protein [Acidovorax sp. sif0732]MBV7448460.1 hypothetical protein [Acidovorax sp. sif0715]